MWALTKSLVPAVPREEWGHETWWKSAVVYQVYPRSFADSNGDGIGDLPGVLAHLDHIAGLGVDVIWMSPVYASPQADNGYDISDYEAVDPSYGSLDDLERLIDGVHARGMKLIMDLVVNHTSDEHPWFVESRRSRVSETADWYFWRDPRPGTIGGHSGAEPNNWGSVFSGSAWQWEPQRGQYFLHLFSAKQPDLNWSTREVRAAVFEMMNWWLDRGVDGFRMDVINFISKDPALPDGVLTPSGYGDGMPYFSSGPGIHDYLSEMKRRVFEGRPGAYLTIGEMPGVTPQQARRFTDRDTGEFNMVFQFDHVILDQDGDKWKPKPLSVSELRDTLARWQDALADVGWNSLYWSNHDQPRAVSRFGDDGVFWRASATALATVLHLHRGTPFIFQGEEIGMTNVGFTDIAQFRDIESLNHYADAVGRLGLPEDAVLATMRLMSRDNARTPMQWTAQPGAGFSAGTPWIDVNRNHVTINAASQIKDPRSIYNYYRELIALRHSLPVVVDGNFDLLPAADQDTFAFRRSLGGRALDVIANLSGRSVTLDPAPSGEVILSNYPLAERSLTLMLPWEARVYSER